GTVKDVGLFATELNTYDNVFLFVPNSELWNTRIKNFTRLERRMIDLEFGVSYDDDLEQAKSVLLALAAGEDRLLDDPAPKTFVKTLGDSSVSVGLRVWCVTSDYWAVRWALTERGKRDLEAAGLSIPFPQMDVHMQPRQAAE
ncbi:MAG: mechanosensitive ion channel family protein, partial [Pseudomonadota bacterium]